MTWRPDLGELVHVASRLVAPALALLPSPGRAAPAVRPEARQEAARRLREGRALLERYPAVRERFGRRFEGDLDELLERAARAVAA